MKKIALFLILPFLINASDISQSELVSIYSSKIQSRLQCSITRELSFDESKEFLANILKKQELIKKIDTFLK